MVVSAVVLVRSMLLRLVSNQKIVHLFRCVRGAVEHFLEICFFTRRQCRITMNCAAASFHRALLSIFHWSAPLDVSALCIGSTLIHAQ